MLRLHSTPLSPWRRFFYNKNKRFLFTSWRFYFQIKNNTIRSSLVCPCKDWNIHTKAVQLVWRQCFYNVQHRICCYFRRFLPETNNSSEKHPKSQFPHYTWPKQRMHCTIVCAVEKQGEKNDQNKTDYSIKIYLFSSTCRKKSLSACTGFNLLRFAIF